MVELLGGRHGQADGAAGSAISQAGKGRLAVLIERNRSDASMTSWCLIGIPGIKGGISSEMSRELSQSEHGVLIQGTKVRDVASTLGLAEFSQPHVCVLS